MRRHVNPSRIGCRLDYSEDFHEPRFAQWPRSPLQFPVRFASASTVQTADAPAHDANLQAEAFTVQAQASAGRCCWQLDAANTSLAKPDRANSTLPCVTVIRLNATWTDIGIEPSTAVPPLAASSNGQRRSSLCRYAGAILVAAAVCGVQRPESASISMMSASAPCINSCQPDDTSSATLSGASSPASALVRPRSASGSLCRALACAG